MEIQGYNNYLIYEDGRVWSKGTDIYHPPRFIKGHKKKSGYMVCSLQKNKKGRNFLTHRLVAEAYIPNPMNKPQVDHIDGNKQNNHVSNLQWATNIENCNGYKTIRSDNTSGHKNISYDERCIKKWLFQKIVYGTYHHKYFNSKIDALCYKYIFILRLKAGHYII